MIKCECTQCGNTDLDQFAPVVKTTGYRHITIDEAKATGKTHGSACLKGYKCLKCGSVQEY